MGQTGRRHAEPRDRERREHRRAAGVRVRAGLVGPTHTLPWYWLEDWSRNSLNRWSELWLGKRHAQIDLADIPVAQLRRAEQSDYDAATANKAAQAETLQQMIRTQEHLDEAASLKWKRAALAAGGSFVTILLFLWIAGLLVEGGWLAIRVAGDVRRLRESADMHTRPLLETTAAEVRLPIRDSGQVQGARV